ncbi:MAG: polysaccharide deacetylase family protein [Pseudobdellovibrio sp.]|nr:polysaccharide deacetylase family protein [Pseudobdellovibrio sp.]
MTILHLLSQNHLTGAEVYACQLTDVQVASGHKVLQVSNGFYYPTKAEKIELKVETKSRAEFNASVKILKDLITKHKVQVIHAHSRAASKLAYSATRGTQIGYISTIHGRQHVSFSKKFKNIYGSHQIAICENVQDQLVNEFGYKPENIKVIRNGISTDLFFPKKISSAKSRTEVLKIAIIGRATGPKKDRTENAVHSLTKILTAKNINFEIHLVGASENEIDKSLHTKNVFFHTPPTLHQGIYTQFDLVIGSGRVCMESLMSGVATIAFGEAKYLGLCQKENFNEQIKSNFGDIETATFGKPEVCPAQMDTDIENYYKINVSQLMDLAKIAKSQFGIKTVCDQIQKIYEASYFEAHYPGWIPVLMYHKIPTQELDSPHKIYVTQDNFVKHLAFYKNAGFETVTFSELKQFKNGTRSFDQFPKKPLVLTFDDGYWDNLNNADPLLKKYNFKAQIFLLANNEISHNQWDEASAAKGDKIISGQDRKLWLNSNFEIGSHGFSHKRITEMTPDQAFAELIDSKRALEKEFEREVCVYAYTYGDTNAACAKLAEAAGYDFAVNTDTGGLKMFDDPFQIFRVNIFPDETKFSLWKKTASWYRAYYFRKRKK